jgi:hypothetical protein
MTFGRSLHSIRTICSMPWKRRCFRQVVFWITRWAWAISTTIRRKCSHIASIVRSAWASDQSGKAILRFSRTTERRIRTERAMNRASFRAPRSHAGRGSAWTTQIATRTATYVSRSVIRETRVRVKGGDPGRR